MLTYAGHELLFPSERVDSWLARNQDLADLNLFSELQPRFASGRHAVRSRFEQNKGLGLPVPNWPLSPMPRLNTLFWPTGATRWARGLFLVTDTIAFQISAATLQGTKPAVLKFGEEGSELSATMFMLPPRPMSFTSSDAVNDLMLLPLVDERYFWQFKDVGDISVTTSTTWADLVSALGTALGQSISVNPSIASQYLNPDPIEFRRRYDNAALLFDAVALSTNRRVVVALDGSTQLQSFSVGKTTYNANTKTMAKLAGGNLGLSPADIQALPEKVRVTFRKMKQYLLRSDNQLYTVEFSAPSSAVTVPGKVLTIHCAAYAAYDTSDTLTNSSTLNDLAQKISDDYYAGTEIDYDFTFAAIHPWTLCAFDDCVLWTFGRSIPGSGQVSIPENAATAELVHPTEYLAQTRVQTLPPNFWAELNACSDSTKEVVEPRLMAIANEDISATSTGMVSLYDSFSHDTGKDIELTNISSVTWQNGKRGWAEGIGDAVWLGTPSECPT